MSNELPVPITPEQTGLQRFSDEQIAGLTGAGYLPRLQLFGANSDAVKEGKIPMAHYGLVKSADSIEDLGPEVSLAVIARRPKALKIDGETIISIYDMTNPQFKAIQDMQDVQDSGCMAGIEFLVWLPDVREFATFYMASKSARREAPNMLRLVRNKATLKATLIKTAKYSWHAPVVTACSAPLSSAPTPEELATQAEKFINAKDSAVEEAAQPDGRAR